MHGVICKSVLRSGNVKGPFWSQGMIRRNGPHSRRWAPEKHRTSLAGLPCQALLIGFGRGCLSWNRESKDPVKITSLLVRKVKGMNLSLAEWRWLHCLHCTQTRTKCSIALKEQEEPPSEYYLAADFSLFSFLVGFLAWLITSQASVRGRANVRVQRSTCQS